MCLLYVVYVQRIDRIPIWGIIIDDPSIVWSWYCNKKKKRKNNSVVDLKQSIVDIYIYAHTYIYSVSINEREENIFEMGNRWV